MKNIVLGILIFFIATINVWGDSDSDYYFIDLIPYEGRGLYVWEKELDRMHKNHAMFYSNEEESGLKFTEYGERVVLGITSVSPRTVWGVSSDGFAIDRKTFLEWDRSQIEKGILISPSGFRFIRVSKIIIGDWSGIWETILRKVFWNKIRGTLNLQNEKNIVFTETGLLYEGENYELILPYGYYVTERGTYFEHMTVDGNIDKILVARYSKGKMKIYKAKYADGLSIVLGEIIGTAIEK